MPKRFDRTDFGSRHLPNCYRLIADRLAEEAATLRSYLHAKYYPDFEQVSGSRRHAILRVFVGWNDVFRALSANLFQASHEIERSLTDSLAIDPREDHRLLLERLRRRRGETDRMIQAIRHRIRGFHAHAMLETRAVSRFCDAVSDLARLFDFVGLTLYQAEAAADPRLAGLDDAMIVAAILGERETPPVIEAEIVLPVEHTQTTPKRPARERREHSDPEQARARLAARRRARG